ncbi:hypothetical protein I3F58_03665 [Streptomyces sp. MUM 203J]|uniref:acetylserotonin O-methyltransferase n=1 Tax=Streptomyces sp. MUM 203J TaxID=2791990 RepID=UPI001F047092|nr:acetylserotonin O-methyltransferase [Streptomyces sp. MUM 203J]MCH0538671.1 hypothetical protein [Streptomyces sp. MUM 203J]
MLTHQGAQAGLRRRMLGLLTGAWTTQAVRTAVELGLVDALADGALPARQAAGRIAADPGATERLLLFLAGLGVVEPRDDGYALTPLGALLRTGVPGSARELALLYGDEFHQSWHELPYAVRTGQEGFARVFGAPAFDHMAERPDMAERFAGAMAFGDVFFESLAEAHDFRGARRVLDVGGGDGALLAQCRWLRGVVVDQPHVSELCGTRMSEAGVADRFAFVGADFFTGPLPPGCDVHILSRILHDWDDDRCVALLRACADALVPGGVVLVVERPLPEQPLGSQDGTVDLATAWNLHMLVNTSSGRERTPQEYQRLFARAGLEPGRATLPLDMEVLAARPAAAAGEAGGEE